ncbi:MAG: sulfotransferase family 2 domain-containing protein [Methyloceanibacter sp.]
MIVSHKHKFIFIKTKKTAGTAIEAALSQLCGPVDVITPYREDSEQDRQGRAPQNFRIEHPLKPKRPLWRKLLGRPERYYHPTVGFYEHMPAGLVRAYVGEQIWRDYYKFAFERNPWDRQVSWYLYKTKSKRVRPSFEQFMSSRRRAFVDNYALYTIDGAIALNQLARYETLQEGIDRILEVIGIDRSVTVRPVNVTPSKDAAHDYRSYYTDKLRELVAEWYAPEIKLLGYGF